MFHRYFLIKFLFQYRNFIRRYRWNNPCVGCWVQNPLGGEKKESKKREFSEIKHEFKFTSLLYAFSEFFSHIGVQTLDGSKNFISDCQSGH